MTAAFVSATVAFLIFALGRWLEVRAKQTDFLRGKLEEYVNCLEEILKVCSMPKTSPGSPLITYRENFRDHATGLAMVGLRPHMLCELYFSESHDRFQRVAVTLAKMNGFMHDFADAGTPKDIAKYTTLYAELGRHVFDLRNYIFSEQGFLTKRLAYTIFA